MSLAFDKRVVLGNDGNFAALTNISSGPPSPGTPAAIIAGLAPDADRLVARVGDPGPGLTYGPFNEIAANGLGQTFFSATTFAPSGNRFTLFSEAAGAIGAPAIIASQGDPVPAIGPNAVLSGPVNLSINDAGQHAFTSIIVEGSALSSAAIFSDSVTTDGSFGIVVRNGDPVPGRPGEIFSNLNESGSSFLSTVLGSAGHVLIANPSIRASGTDVGSGIYLRSPGPNGQLETIHTFRSSDVIKASFSPVDGLPLDAGNYELPISLASTVNARGQVAFMTHITGDIDNNDEYDNLSVSDSGNTLYATDLDGTLHIVARTGQLFDVSSNPNFPDLREILTLSVVDILGVDSAISLESGRGTFFNDAGQLAFTATFTDGTSGVFVASTFMIPEPGSLALLSLGGVALLGRRRRNA